MKIVFLDAAPLADVSMAPIEALGELVCYRDSTPQEALSRVSDAEVVIVNRVNVTDELLAAAPKLKLVCEAATGMDNIDLKAAERRNIPVRNVAGYSTDSVVQITFTLILSLISDLSGFDAEVKDGTYSHSGLFTDISKPFIELAGKTIGIIGMGAIGSKLASVASAFGMKVIYHSTSGTSHCSVYQSVSLDELLRRSDVVSIHCPLNERTSGLIGEKELLMMKRTAVLVNAARGGIVDEAALSKAVGNGTISGAGVDVFTSEPLPLSNPLLHCARPNRIILTPHIAWASNEAIERLVLGIANNIRAK